MMKRLFLFLIFWILLVPSALTALTFKGPILELGVNRMINKVHEGTDPGNKDPDPLLFTLGGSFPLTQGRLLFQPGFHFSMKTYKYLYDKDLSMPVDPAVAGGLYTLGLILDSPLGAQFKTKAGTYSILGGPSFFLRFPLWGDGGDDRAAMFGSFYKGGRFLYLQAQGSGSWSITETLDISTNIRTYIPISNVWMGTGLPFSDGLMISFSVGFQFLTHP